MSTAAVAVVKPSEMMDVLSEECRSLRRPGGFEVCIIAGQSDFSARPLNDFIQEVLEFP